MLHCGLCLCSAAAVETSVDWAVVTYAIMMNVGASSLRIRLLIKWF